MLKTIFFFLCLTFTLTSRANGGRHCICDTIPKKDSVKQTISIEAWLMQSDSVEDKDAVFQKVEIEPSIDRKLWTQHLQKSIKAFMDSAADKRIPAGSYTVQVRFLVEKDGTIKEATALNDPGYGLNASAVKIVETGPKWRPAIQNGRIVRGYHTQPIVFIIEVAEQ